MIILLFLLVKKTIITNSHNSRNYHSKIYLKVSEVSVTKNLLTFFPKSYLIRVFKPPSTHNHLIHHPKNWASDFFSGYVHENYYV